MTYHRDFIYDHSEAAERRQRINRPWTEEEKLAMAKQTDVWSIGPKISNRVHADRIRRQRVATARRRAA